jgi:hypothetical protein
MSLFFKSVKKGASGTVKKDEPVATVIPKGLVYGVNVKDLEEPVPQIIDDILGYVEKHCIRDKINL